MLFLNRNLKIETLPFETVNSNNWAMNKRAIGVVDGMEQELKRSAIFRAVLGIIRDENILKCFKAQLIDDISARLLFFALAQELISGNGEKVLLVPANNQNYGIQNELFADGRKLGADIPKPCFFANCLSGLLRKTCAVTLFFFLPELYILSTARKISFRRIKKVKYDIAMPVIWGFHKGDTIIEGINRGLDDGYLYNHKIKAGSVIHIFKWWRSSPEIEEGYRQAMRARGIPFADKKEYKINRAFFIKAFKIKLKIYNLHRCL